MYVCMYVWLDVWLYMYVSYQKMNTTGPWCEHDPRSPGSESGTARRSAADRARVNLTLNYHLNYCTFLLIYFDIILSYSAVDTVNYLCDAPTIRGTHHTYIHFTMSIHHFYIIHTYMHTYIQHCFMYSAVSFVGGNAAGEHIFDRATKTGKRVQANLG